MVPTYTPILPVPAARLGRHYAVGTSDHKDDRRRARSGLVRWEWAINSRRDFQKAIRAMIRAALDDGRGGDDDIVVPFHRPQPSSRPLTFCSGLGRLNRFREE
jgi:hypothetical protein